MSAQFKAAGRLPVPSRFGGPFPKEGKSWLKTGLREVLPPARARGRTQMGASWTFLALGLTPAGAGIHSRCGHPRKEIPWWGSTLDLNNLRRAWTWVKNKQTSEIGINTIRSDTLQLDLGSFLIACLRRTGENRKTVTKNEETGSITWARYNRWEFISSLFALYKKREGVVFSLVLLSDFFFGLWISWNIWIHIYGFRGKQNRILVDLRADFAGDLAVIGAAGAGPTKAENDRAQYGDGRKTVVNVTMNPTLKIILYCPKYSLLNWVQIFWKVKKKQGKN